MYESKKTPGKRFGSAYVGKRYDEQHQGEEMESPKAGNEVKRAMDKTEEPMDKEGMDHEIVKAHGPATHVHIKHDHTANKHHVTSHHEDGHVNESDHETAEEAHEEGGRLANVSLKKSGEAEDQQLAASEGGNSSTPDGFQMPELA